MELNNNVFLCKANFKTISILTAQAKLVLHNLQRLFFNLETDLCVSLHFLFVSFG